MGVSRAYLYYLSTGHCGDEGEQLRASWLPRMVQSKVLKVAECQRGSSTGGFVPSSACITWNCFVRDSACARFPVGSEGIRQVCC